MHSFLAAAFARWHEATGFAPARREREHDGHAITKKEIGLSISLDGSGGPFDLVLGSAWALAFASRAVV
jgi:hypothetical protein